MVTNSDTMMNCCSLIDELPTHTSWLLGRQYNIDISSSQYRELVFILTLKYLSRSFGNNQVKLLHIPVRIFDACHQLHIFGTCFSYSFEIWYDTVACPITVSLKYINIYFLCMLTVWFECYVLMTVSKYLNRKYQQCTPKKEIKERRLSGLKNFWNFDWLE